MYFYFRKSFGFWDFTVDLVLLGRKYLTFQRHVPTLRVIMPLVWIDNCLI